MDNKYHVPFQLMRTIKKDGVSKQYYSFRWSEDGTPEWCEHEIITLDKDVECQGCLKVMKKGSEAVRLISPQGDVLHLEPACAYKH